MLQAFSDGLRNSKVLAGVIIVVIVVPFALWGIGSYIQGGGETYAAVVNDVEISQRELDRAYAEQRNRLQEMFGGRLPAQFADGALLRRQALDSLINRELLFQQARSDGYAISDSSLAQWLLQIDAFKVDGRFEQSRYEQQLRSQGMSPTEFEQSAKANLIIDQMRRALVASDFVLRKESLQMQALRNQRRSLKYISLPLEPVRQAQSVTDEEVREYFEQNASDFAELPKVRVEYIELDEAALADMTDVSDADIEQAYESRRAEFRTAEEREAAHILLTLPADADSAQVEERMAQIDELRQQILDGASFEELARQHSEDPGSANEGGNLGSVAPGLMVPEFEQALFAMESVGDVSEPVRTDFGLHLIKLLGIAPSTEQTLDEVRARIEDDLRRQRAESLFFDRAELLGNASYENPGSLQPAAEATGLAVQTSEWFDASSTEGLAEFPALRNAALSGQAIEERHNSELIDLGNNHVVVFRVVDYQPSEPKPFEEVAAEIREFLLTRKAIEAMREKTDSVIQALKDGGEPQAVAKESGGEWVEAGDVGRNDAVIDRRVVEDLFELPKPGGDQASYGSSRLNNGDYAVLVLDNVDVPTAQISIDADTERAVEQARGSRTFEAWLRYLRETADVRVADNLFE